MTEPNKKKSKNLSLWIPVVLAFVLIGTAWYFLINIAREHPTERVTLETAPETAQHASDAQP